MTLDLLHAAKKLFTAGAKVRRAARRAGIEEPPFDEDSLLPLRLQALMRPEGRSIVLERFDVRLRRVEERPLPGGFSPTVSGGP